MKIEPTSEVNRIGDMHKVISKKSSVLTGKDSLNSTDRYQVYGTDLGSMWEYQGKIVMVFGDTFGPKPSRQSGPGGENWRSNVMAVSSDMDPTDGVTFDTMIVDEQGRAKELLPAKKVDNKEITVIPTHVFVANDNLYIFRFSRVSHVFQKRL